MAMNRDRKKILKQLRELVEQAEIMARHSETLGHDQKATEYEEMGDKYDYLASLVEDDLESNPNDDAVEYDPADGEGHQQLEFKFIDDRKYQDEDYKP